MLPGTGLRPLARGRGRGNAQPKVLTEEEKHGLPPGFDFKNLDQSAKTLTFRQTMTGGRGLQEESTIIVER